MDIRRGKVYALLFVLFIIFLALGGFFLTMYLTKDTNNDNIVQEEDSKEEEVNLKIVQDEDYIYFENEEVISESLEIIFKDVNININSSDAGKLSIKLNEEVSTYKENLKRISEEEISDEDTEKILYPEEDIYSTNYMKFTSYFYGDYASLYVEKYSFDCFQGSINTVNVAYTFNVLTGHLLTNTEIMDIYNTNLDGLKMLVQIELEKKEEEDIDIEETLKSLDDDNFALYINKNGHLTLSYLVKSSENDYNDVIIFN